MHTLREPTSGWLAACSIVGLKTEDTHTHGSAKYHGAAAEWHGMRRHPLCTHHDQAAGAPTTTAGPKEPAVLAALTHEA